MSRTRYTVLWATGHLLASVVVFWFLLMAFVYLLRSTLDVLMIETSMPNPFNVLGFVTAVSVFSTARAAVSGDGDG